MSHLKMHGTTKVLNARPVELCAVVSKTVIRRPWSDNCTMTALSSLPVSRGYRSLLDRQASSLASGTATSRPTPTCNAAQSVSEPTPQGQQERKQVKLPERGFFAEANTKGARPVPQLGNAIAAIVTGFCAGSSAPPPYLARVADPSHPIEEHARSAHLSSFET